MSLHFSANQFEQAYRPKGLNNWELPRFAPPRPRLLKTEKSKFICDNNGHLLPNARRDGNSFGQYRGTWQLPDRITRKFVQHYDACLTGRFKYRHYPRDLCFCHLEKIQNCDKLTQLGAIDDPYWAKPKCQTKCAGWNKIKNWNKPKQKFTQISEVERARSSQKVKKIKQRKDTIGQTTIQKHQQQLQQEQLQQPQQGQGKLQLLKQQQKQQKEKAKKKPTKALPKKTSSNKLVGSKRIDC